MESISTEEKLINEASSFIKKRFNNKSDTLAILGSGFSTVTKSVEILDRESFSSIPNFMQTSVEGHKGELILCKYDTSCFWILSGRTHLYEGIDIKSVVRPLRALIKTGIKKLLITNAAGGINTSFNKGSLMLTSDHINLSGANPLTGENISSLGTRFPSMNNVYSERFTRILEEEASRLDIKTHRGVYVCLAGPSYETPAEIRMLRLLGADAVGMSSVFEAIAAKHASIETGALSLISNMAAGIEDTPLSHQEVIETASAMEEKLSAFVLNALKRISLLGE